MSFCNRFRQKIKSALQQFDRQIEENAEEALRITRTIKTALESPLADLVTTIIPGDADEKIRLRIIQALDTGINALSIINTCKEQETWSDKIRCFVNELRKVSPELQDAIMQKLQSILLRELDGNTKKQHLYDLFSQAKYSSTK